MKLAVVGTFDRDGGRSSYIGERILNYLGWEGINGGHIDNLKSIDFEKIKSLLWMPNIPNEEDKIITEIKKKNPKLILVSSKNCQGRDFSYNDMVGRLLKHHSAIGVMIDKVRGEYVFDIIDALGNLYYRGSNIESFTKNLHMRVHFLERTTRVSSNWVGEKNSFEIDPEFIQIVQSYGEKFSEFVNAINPNRFLGNAATRCSFGFPAIRKEKSIFVTRRNVDKTQITQEDFVEVRDHILGVSYFGDNKPSVDAPIQLKLFELFKEVNYIIHGHVYTRKGFSTNSKFPCGCLQEVDEIYKNARIRKERSNFQVNLLGHGCLIMAKDLDYFSEVELVPRPFPEGF